MLVELLDASHRDEFLAAVKASEELHHPWVSPPATAEAFSAYAARPRATHVSYVVRSPAGDIVGCVSITEIVRGPFQSAYLSYYAFAPHQGRGFMKQGLAEVVERAFTTHGLHRLEANVQPANRASRSLVRSLGFRREGFSPRYLRIGGQWRDHERWAITAEEWSR